jgi:hypothetical protein
LRVRQHPNASPLSPSAIIVYFNELSVLEVRLDLVPESLHPAGWHLWMQENVVKQHDPLLPHEWRIHLKILLYSPIAVVPIDEEHVYCPTV